MRTPSRMMPAYEAPEMSLFWKLFIYLFVGWMFVMLLMQIWETPMLAFFILAVVLVSWIDDWLNEIEFHMSALEREGEDIGTFARSFDYRKVDTCVIRAVYDALSRCFSYRGVVYPFRASDRLVEDLNIDSEELEDIAEEVMQRTGRVDKDWEKNPYYNKLETVRDLVLFFDAQPRRIP